MTQNDQTQTSIVSGCRIEHVRDALQRCFNIGLQYRRRRGNGVVCSEALPQIQTTSGVHKSIEHENKSPLLSPYYHLLTGTAFPRALYAELFAQIALFDRVWPCLLAADG